MGAMQTLSEQRQEIYQDQNMLMCCSMALYVRLERNTRPDCPDYVELACYSLKGTEGILLYQSPVDALISQGNIGRRAHQLYPFEAIDPRIFIQSHDGWLTLYIVYGFAANNNKLLLNESGFPCPHIHTIYIPFDLENIPEHIHIDFSGNTIIDRLNKLHRQVGLPDYQSLVYEQAQCSMAELEIMTSAALQAVDYQDAQDHEVTQCAIYDPIEVKWRFVDWEVVCHINR
jgi:hypothetical protein